MSTNAQTVTALEAQHVLQTYKRLPVVFVRGEGTRLFDESGRGYLDFISGIGVVVLGHAHAGLAAVVADQAKTLIHTSNLYYHPLQGQLAAKLASLSGLQRSFFCNSGTEAVEACLKFARRYWYSKGVKHRTGYVALEHGFSGRTFEFQGLGWTPDLVTIGKAIGSGIPIGAALVAEHVAKEIFPGDHGTTYGGNLLSTRAAIYVLDQLSGPIAANVKAVGPVFERRLLDLQKKHPVVRSVRGAGLMRGLELAVDAQPAIDAALKAGLLVNRTAERVIRMLPPLTVSVAEIDEAIGILDRALASVPAPGSGVEVKA